MRTAKIFKSGNSWALRLPKEFHFHSKVVEIFKRDGEVVVREPNQNLSGAFKLLTTLPNDFYPKNRKDTPPQKRKFF